MLLGRGGRRSQADWGRELFSQNKRVNWGGSGIFFCILDVLISIVALFHLKPFVFRLKTQMGGIWCCEEHPTHAASPLASSCWAAPQNSGCDHPTT